MPRIVDAARGFSATSKGIADIRAQEGRLAELQKRTQLAEMEIQLRASQADQQRQQQIANKRALQAYYGAMQNVQNGVEAPPPGEESSITPGPSGPVPDDVSTHGLDLEGMGLPRQDYFNKFIDDEKQQEIQEDAAFEAKMQGRKSRLQEALKYADAPTAQRLIQQDMALAEMEKDEFSRQRVMGELQDNLASDVYLVDGESEMQEPIAARVDQMLELGQQSGVPGLAAKLAGMNAGILEAVNDIENVKIKKDGAIAQLEEVMGDEGKNSPRWKQYQLLAQAVRRGNLDPEDVVHKIIKIKYGISTSKEAGGDRMEQRTNTIDMLGQGYGLGAFPEALVTEWGQVNRINDETERDAARERVIEKARRSYYGSDDSVRTPGPASEGANGSALDQLDQSRPAMDESAFAQPAEPFPPPPEGMVHIQEMRAEPKKYERAKKAFKKIMMSDGPESDLEDFSKKFGVTIESILADPELRAEMEQWQNEKESPPPPEFPKHLP